MAETAIELATADLLYAFFQYPEVDDNLLWLEFFVCIDEATFVQLPHHLGTRPSPSQRGVARAEPPPVLFVQQEDFASYDELHEYLHRHLGRKCKGQLNTKIRRTGKDSWFSEMIRCGNGTPKQPAGCHDTPVMDIDALRLGKSPCIIEYKYPNEQTGYGQNRLLEALRCRGLLVEKVLRVANE